MGDALLKLSEIQENLDVNIDSKDIENFAKHNLVQYEKNNQEIYIPKSEVRNVKLINQLIKNETATIEDLKKIKIETNQTIEEIFNNFTKDKAYYEHYEAIKQDINEMEVQVEHNTHTIMQNRYHQRLDEIEKSIIENYKQNNEMIQSVTMQHNGIIDALTDSEINLKNKVIEVQEMNNQSNDKIDALTELVKNQQVTIDNLVKALENGSKKYKEADELQMKLKKQESKYNRLLKANWLERKKIKKEIENKKSE